MLQLDRSNQAEWSMKQLTVHDDFERFLTGAVKYAAYIETTGADYAST